jgi:hypothetical protein
MTVPINFSGAVTFSLPALRQLIGLPESTQPFYSLLVGIWIGLFGLAYLRLAITQSYDRTFVAVGALGKLSFFVLAVIYFFQNELGLLALLASVIDAILAIIFLIWLKNS